MVGEARAANAQTLAAQLILAGVVVKELSNERGFQVTG